MRPPTFTTTTTVLAGAVLLLGLVGAVPASAGERAAPRPVSQSAAGIVGLSPAATTAPLTWSVPTLVDRQSPLGGSVSDKEMSCPTPTLCVTVGWDSDGVGYVASSTNPTGGVSGWKVVSHVADSSLMSAISCPTTGLCVGVDAGGDVITSTDPTGGATSWVVTELNAGYLIDIDCPSATLCVAIDRGGFVITSTNPTGGPGAWIWSNLGNYGLMSVSCPSASLCVATDYSGNVVTSTDPTGGAGAWTVAHIDGNQTLYDVDCPSASLCVTVDGSGALLSSTNPTGGAAAWTLTQLTDFGTYSSASATVSCPSESLCVVGETIYDRPSGLVFTSVNPTGGVGSWSSSDLNLSYVDCPTATLCVGGDAGNLATSTNPTGGAGTWSSMHLSSGSSAITGIWCPSATLCVAVDDAGNVLTSTNPATGPWTFTHVNGAALDPIAFVGVACPSASLCVAVDEVGAVFTSTDPTGAVGSWSRAAVDTGHRFWSIACASASLCVGADGDGNVVTSTNPTGGAGAWTVTHIDSFATGLTYLSGISCPSESFCVAVDGAGNSFISDNPTGGAAAWSRVRATTATLLGISCPSSALCVAVGYAGTLVVLTPTAITAVTIDSGHPLTAISCPSTSLCVAVDANGDVVMSTDPTGGAAAWGPAVAVDVAGLTDVACPSSTFCVAADGVGRVAIGSYVQPPPTFTVSSSTTLTGARTVTFSQDVHGVSSASVQLRVDGTSTAVAVGYVCRTAAATVVTCGGYVRSVALTPTSGHALVPGQYYRPYVSSAVTNASGSSPTTVAARFRASTIEQESSAAASYSWRKVGTSLAYGGSYVVERAAGAAASYAFRGPSITWYTIVGPAQGWAYVYVDGVLRAKVNTYARALRYHVGYGIWVGGASTTSHTVRIVVAGLKGSTAATGAQVSIDAIKVGASLNQTPGVVVSWRSVALSVASGGRYATSDLAGAAVTLTFRGRSVSWWQVVSPSQGIARVYIDGVLKATVNGYYPTTKVVVRTFSVTDALHTIRIVVVGTRSTASKGTGVSCDRWSIG